MLSLVNSTEIGALTGVEKKEEWQGVELEALRRPETSGSIE